MIMRVDHVAVAVNDHDKALAFFRDILGALPGGRFEDKISKFFWQTLALGDLSRLELLSPSAEGSFLEGFLKERSGGFHHITLQTAHMSETIKKLEDLKVPYFGHREYPDGSWKEIFIHPKDAFGVLIQIAEFDAEHWMVPEAKLPQGVRWEVKHGADGCVLTCAHPGGGKVTIKLNKEEARSLAQALLEEQE